MVNSEQAVDSVDNSLIEDAEKFLLHGASDEDSVGFFETNEKGEYFPGLEEFLDAGGTVTDVPAQPADPKIFEPKAKPIEKADKLSNYAKVRVPKGEGLSNRLSMSSQDFTAVASGSGSDRPTSEQIHAALANQGLSEFEEKFMLYVFTEEKRYRSAAWAHLMERAADISIRENWNVRKDLIMDKMCHTMLDHFLHPEKYKYTSTREWAAHMGLSCNKDWSRRWCSRYNQLMDYGNQLLANGQEILARNF